MSGEMAVRVPRQAGLTLILLLLMTGMSFAQKPGGTLRVYHRDSPASMSIYEETTLSTSMPMMGVFNNLVVFDPDDKQNRLDNIIAVVALLFALERVTGRGLGVIIQPPTA